MVREFPAAAVGNALLLLQCASMQPWQRRFGHYLLLDRLGDGSFGRVVRCVDERDLSQEVAIKLLPRGDRIRDHQTNVKREIMHQGCLNHPVIANLKEVFLTPHHLAIVMECANGGTMRDYLLKQPNHRLPEVLGRWIFQQLIIGLDYCHTRGVANRDLKLENLLVVKREGEGARPLLKICDFGFSKDVARSGTAKTGKVGTPVYMAPEVVLGSSKYDGKKADIWSCGVILYVMLTGQYPFNTRDRNHCVNIVNARYMLPTDVELSESSKDLIRGMLTPNTVNRFGVADIKQHPWFLEDLPDGALDMNSTLMQQAHSLDEKEALVNNIIQQSCHLGHKGLLAKSDCRQQARVPARQHRPSAMGFRAQSGCF
eukprot:jgi/Astpho2/3766/fgenesh1_pg.00060_%23_64_t